MQLAPCAAQNPGQLPDQVANSAAGHELTADPALAGGSHRPVVAQNPQPCLAHASQLVKRRSRPQSPHGSRRPAEDHRRPPLPAGVQPVRVPRPPLDRRRVPRAPRGAQRGVVRRLRRDPRVDVLDLARSTFALALAVHGGRCFAPAMTRRRRGRRHRRPRRPRLQDRRVRVPRSRCRLRRAHAAHPRPALRGDRRAACRLARTRTDHCGSVAPAPA